MRLITRSTIALFILLGFATQLLANPDVAIRINAPARNCFPVTLKNLRGTPVGVTSAEMRLFDQKSCKLVCESRIPLGKKLLPCQTLSFRICCEKPLPATYICYVRVNYGGGMNEEWFFRP